jgi:hypothetical protein
MHPVTRERVEFAAPLPAWNARHAEPGRAEIASLG